MFASARDEIVAIIARWQAVRSITRYAAAQGRRCPGHDALFDACLMALTYGLVGLPAPCEARGSIQGSARPEINSDRGVPVHSRGRRVSRHKWPNACPGGRALGIVLRSFRHSLRS